MDPITALTLGKGLFDIGSSIFKGKKAKRIERNQARRLKKQKEKQRELENIYKNIDTSNPYLNMENTMEDLTVNQQQADFEKQAFQQTQANIMENLRGAAGGSGIASLAQSLAQQGQIQAQKSSASIGQQEAANERARAAQAGQIQSMERQGEIMSRDQQRDQTETLMGLQLQKIGGTSERLAQARQAKMDAVSSGMNAGLNMLTAGVGGQEGVTADTKWSDISKHLSRWDPPVEPE
tara:strand:+ start:9221 stop:9931 length:711 start_codon:yes stop_codon:yes gene_type:complete